MPIIYGAVYKVAYAIAIVPLLLSLVLAPAFALDASPTAKQREELQKRQMELKEKRATLAAETRELRVSRIKMYFERMSKRTKAASEWYTKFLTRVEGRREKLAAQGKSVTKLNTFIAQAHDNQAKVVAAQTKLDADIAKLDTSTNPKQVLLTLRSDLAQVKRALQELHATMKTVVQELKKLGGTGSGRSTGSATTR